MPTPRSILLVFALLFAVAPLRADEPAAMVDGGYRHVLEALASDDYAVREQTMYSLLGNPRLTDDVIDKLYEQSWLPEQRHRLLRVAHHRLLDSFRKLYFQDGKKAAVGIVFRALSIEEIKGQTSGQVLVLDVLPGFPAYAQLRPGDLITAVDRRPIPGRQTDEVTRYFQEMLASKKPGQSVAITAKRGDENLTIDVTLADQNMLGDMYQTETRQLMTFYESRWEARMQELAKRQKAVVEPLHIELNDAGVKPGAGGIPQPVSFD